MAKFSLLSVLVSFIVSYFMENKMTMDLECIQTNPAIGDRGNIHIYHPEAPGPRPFILAVHGGGWRNGDQSSFAFLWPKIRPLGFALVLASYRLAPEFPFPCAYDDLVHLLAWLKDQGTAHGLDATRCALYGSSAGGHLVMLLATRATRESRPMPVLRGVAEHCGVMDMAAMYTQDKKRGQYDTITEQFLGDTPQANPAVYREASPIQNIHKDVPPIWIAHGTDDDIVPVSQSREMVRRLGEMGHDPVYLEGRKLGHTMCEMTVEGAMVEPLILLFEHDLLRFFQRVLK